MAAIRTVLVCLWLFSVQLAVAKPSVFIIDSYQRSNSILNMSEQRPTFEEYKRERNEFIEREDARGLGADLVLNEKEQRLNKHVMKLKIEAIQNGMLHPAKFTPAQHFFEVMEEINGTELFQILRKMPKGGALHIHDTAVCNLDFIVQLTYWDHLWQLTNPETKRPKFRFSRGQPAAEDGLEWQQVRTERKRRGAEAYDAELREQVSLFTRHPNTEARDVDSMWVRFMEIFSMTDGILLYKDAWEAYFLQALTEFGADQVDYLEVRSTLPKVSEAKSLSSAEVGNSSCPGGRRLIRRGGVGIFLSSD